MAKDGLGYGRTRYLKDGDFFEKAGVNFSEISGNNPPQSLLGHKPELQGQPFWGAGYHLFYPHNPFCPTVHLNYRYFETDSFWWFAGGCDLTPYYPFMEDYENLARSVKNRLDKHDTCYYPALNIGVMSIFQSSSG